MMHSMTARTSGRSAVVLLARFRELGILVFLAVLVLFTSIEAHSFFTRGNIENIIIDISLLVIVAAGETMVILGRQIDLSIGSTLGACGIAIGFFLKSHPSTPVVMALALGLAIGLVLGSVNGLIVTVARVPAIIATLGTLSVYRGLAYVISGGHQVNAEDLPNGLISIAQTSPLRIPWIVFMAAGIALAVAIYLQFTRPGRDVYAVGSNPLAASLRGVRVQWVILLEFAVCGALAGLAGVLYAGRYATVNPGAGAGFELEVIAAVVVGGTNIVGGSGSVLGTVFGCLLLGTMNNALAVLNLSEYWQATIQGAIILAAVVTDTSIRRRLQRALQGVRR